MASTLSHPYFPEDAVIAGGFKENESSLVVVVGSFVGIIAAVLLGSLAVASRVNPILGLADFGLILWFVLSGFLHVFFEGYFIFNRNSLASSQGLFSQLWKEYSLSDSRYLTADTFVLSIETITVLFWGPCCLATAVCIAKGSSLRYPLQMVACMAHLYGVALYYSTSYVDMTFKAVLHSRPEFLYFWVYYVGMNLPWAVVPAVILLSTTKKICRAVDALEQTGSTASSFATSNAEQALKKNS